MGERSISSRSRPKITGLHPVAQRVLVPNGQSIRKARSSGSLRGFVEWDYVLVATKTFTGS